MVAVIIKGVVGKERFLILDAKGSAATRQGGGLPGGSYGSLGSSKSKPGTMEDRNSANLNILQTNIF